jgi:hypothetical protein
VFLAGFNIPHIVLSGMVVNSFDLYDILTNLVPGIVAVLFFSFALLPVNVINSFSDISGAAIVLPLIAVAYVIGRIIRNVNLLFVINIIFNIKEFKDYVKEFIKEGDKFDDSTIKNFYENLSNKHSVNIDQNNTNIDVIIQVGYADLWRKESLYQRYNIVSNFYESLCNLFLLAFIFYSLASVDPVIKELCDENLTFGYSTHWTDALSDSLFFLVFLLFFLLLYIASLIQFTKFEERRAYQFVIDIVNSDMTESNQLGPAS